MSRPYYCGIDPGKTGAMAIYCPSENTVWFEDTPKSIHDQANKVRSLWLDYKPVMTLIEQVNPFGMGVTSAFTFGHGVGAYEGAMATVGMPYQFVAPQKWQGRTCGSHPKGLDKRQKTQRVYEWLIRQLPWVVGLKNSKGKLIDGRVDALALAVLASKL